MNRASRLLAVPTALTLAVLATGASACADEGGKPTDRRPAAGASGTGNAKSSARPRTVRVGNFDHPVEIKAAPGFPRLMFVVEQGGRVMVMRRGRKLARPFLDIRGKVDYDGGERGLLSVAFPPDYRRSKRFYVYYTDTRGDIRVVEYRRRSAVRARRNAARPVIRIPHPGASNHNGGSLQFLGRYLYFGTGDGGGSGDAAGNAQSLRSLLGKLIRIDPRRRGRRPYTSPASNPFVGRPGRDEIFAYGFRNPYRWNFDRTGRRVRIAIGDVGQDRFEEINFLNLRRARGANFGWNRWEGFEPFDGGGGRTIKPSLVLGHPPNCSVIGGLVVRDRALPALRGRYVFTDFCAGKVLSFKPNLGRTGYRRTGLGIDRVTSFGESLGGALFVTTLPGAVYRIRQ